MGEAADRFANTGKGSTSMLSMQQAKSGYVRLREIVRTLTSDESTNLSHDRRP